MFCANLVDDSQVGCCYSAGPWPTSHALPDGHQGHDFFTLTHTHTYEADTDNGSDNEAVN
jgi:hypothetical protein